MTHEQDPMQSPEEHDKDMQTEHADNETRQPPESEAHEDVNTENSNIEYSAFSDSIDDTEAPHQQDQSFIPNADQVRIAVLEKELDRTKDQMIRALAEAENARKRAIREREDASKFAVSGFAKDILSVSDNLRRALDSISPELQKEHNEIKNLMSGIEATERELLRSFEKNGIKKVIPIDQPFDPNFHEVMFEAPMPGKPTGTVIQIIEPGYTINGRILRPARVGIAKADPNQGNKDTGHTINTEV